MSLAGLAPVVYAPAVRAPAWVLCLAFAGCRPSATVENTMPVANLQSYTTVALRVKSTAFASQGLATFLERAVQDKLGKQCAFQPAASGAPADIVLDLNITHSGRGSSGFVTTTSSATVETLLVLSDGLDGELIGTAKIRGKSGGVIINNRPPENDAIDAVAKSVVDLLAKSGCGGPRIARPEPAKPPVTTVAAGSGSAGSGSGTTEEPPPPPDDARRAEADALNEEGKLKLRSADTAGALAAFQQAMSIAPDARYQFNVCLTFEAQEQWNSAIMACQKARTLNPQPALMAKIDNRLEKLQRHP